MTHPYREATEQPSPVKVGDLRARVSDGALVEVIDTNAGSVCVMPYHAMHGHKRQRADRALAAWCPPSELRDVTNDDLSKHSDPVREALMNEHQSR